MKLNLFCILLLTFVLIGTVYGAEGDTYEPEKLKATMEEDVLLYIPGVDVGVTSIQLNKYSSLLIKSKTGKKFTIVNFSSVTINEALMENGNKLSHNVQHYKVKKSRLKVINKEIGPDGISLDSIMDLIRKSDVDMTLDGSKEAPDPKKFSKLRNAFVYNFVVKDHARKQFPLQIYIEYFTDASQLR